MEVRRSQEELRRIYKNQDARLRLEIYNTKNGSPYNPAELARIHRKWRMLGRLANQPASLRNAENHN